MDDIRHRQSASGVKPAFILPGNARADCRSHSPAPMRRPETLIPDSTGFPFWESAAGSFGAGIDDTVHEPEQPAQLVRLLVTLRNDLLVVPTNGFGKFPSVALGRQAAEGA
jgi:hypothetical protein